MIGYYFKVNAPRSAVETVFSTCGKIRKSGAAGFSWKFGFLNYAGVYVQQNGEICSVKLCLYPHDYDNYLDKFWDRKFKYDKKVDEIYDKLKELYPDVTLSAIPSHEGLGVSEAKVLTNGTKEVYYTSSHRSPSLGGFLIGGMIFGAVGAIVGGTAGKSRSYTVSDIVPSDRYYVQAVLTNGRYTEGWLKRDNPMMQQILLNTR